MESGDIGPGVHAGVSRRRMHLHHQEAGAGLRCVCGRLFTRYEPEPVPDTQLLLADSNGTVVAEARTDAKGDFKFPPLGRGVYSVQSADGWVIMPGQNDIQIASPGAEKCTRPLTVYVGLSYPDCQGGWVSPKRPPKGKQEGEK